MIQLYLENPSVAEENDTAVDVGIEVKETDRRINKTLQGYHKIDYNII